jgi:hypothetical protein
MSRQKELSERALQAKKEAEARKSIARKSTASHESRKTKPVNAELAARDAGQLRLQKEATQTSDADDDTLLLSAKKVRERYGVSDMSLWRWLADEALNFPLPLVIQKRRYWRFRDLIAWENTRRADLVAAREQASSRTTA